MSEALDKVRLALCELSNAIDDARSDSLTTELGQERLEAFDMKVDDLTREFDTAFAAPLTWDDEQDEGR